MTTTDTLPLRDDPDVPRTALGRGAREQRGGERGDEDVDDEPDALERIHQRGHFDVEGDRRSTEEEHHHADDEDAEEPEVVPAQGGEVDGDDQQGADEGELVHIRPRHPFGRDPARDRGGEMEREAEGGERDTEAREVAP